jgi:hypothetical protein
MWNFYCRRQSGFTHRKRKSTTTEIALPIREHMIRQKIAHRTGTTSTLTLGHCRSSPPMQTQLVVDSTAAAKHKYGMKRQSWMHFYSSHWTLILWTVSRPIELSLQSSLQLSLTVLVRYRSHCDILSYAEFTTLLSCTTKQLDSFKAIPTVASQSHRVSTFCDQWLLSGRHGK